MTNESYVKLQKNYVELWKIAKKLSEMLEDERLKSEKLIKIVKDYMSYEKNHPIPPFPELDLSKPFLFSCDDKK